jgi:peptidoglycan-associated lipoprotein
MYRKKTFLAVTLLVVAALVFSGCASKKDTETLGPTGEPETVQPTWQPEPEPTQSLEVEDADYYNKLGVLQKIHFETDKWDILPEYRQVLKDNANWIVNHTDFKVTIEGHCDERNTEAYNLALGERRANAAKEYLIGLGVPANLIQTVSYGKARPLDPNRTEEAFAKNRRDMFLLRDVN